MIILGIETSCDETSAALVKDGRHVISSVISSQAQLHNKYGGVVPELASRRHIESISPVVEEALIKAAPNGVSDLNAIDAIAVTVRPGLIGALLVGVSFAKALAYASGKPLLPVNHLYAHIKSVFLDQHPLPHEPGSPLPYPYLALVVSGGHSQIYKVEQAAVPPRREIITLICATRDDSSGEAFDKGAKILGLGYPGGYEIDQRAKQGNPDAFPFPKPLPQRKILDMSFSGLKTALLNTVQPMSAREREERLVDLCASYQDAIIEMIIRKTLLVCDDTGIRNVVVTGGVSANSRLRETCERVGQREGIHFVFPLKSYTTDNAAMIAAEGFSMHQNGFSLSHDDLLALDASPTAD